MNINTEIKLLLLLYFQNVQGQLSPQKAPELGANPLKLMEICCRRCFEEKKIVLFISENTSYINVPDSAYSQSIIILNANFKNPKDRIVSNIASIKLVDIYIFDVELPNVVKSLLNIIPQDTHAWNNDAYFFVIMSIEHCAFWPGIIFDFLKDMVDGLELTVYLMCQDTIWTYNPYADLAPEVWKPYHHPYINMFSRGHFYLNHITDEYTCSDLLFDPLHRIRTDHKLFSVVLEITGDDECNLNESPKRSVMLNHAIRIAALLSKLTGISFNHRCVYEKSYTDAAGSSRGPAIKGIVDGRYNMLLNPQPIKDINETAVSAITGKMSIVIIMHHQKTLSIIQRIVQYFGVWGFVACLIVGVISTFILKCCLKASFLWSAMQSVALLLVDTAKIRPRRTSLRIFIVIVSLLGFALTTTFSNDVLLSIYGPKNNYVKTVKEFEAIVSQYKLYCPPGMDLYVNEYLKQFCFPIIDHGCEIILNDPKAACVYYKRSSYEMVVKNNLHIVPERLSQAYVGYRTRFGWKLREFYNRAISRVFESHIPSVLVNQYIYRFHRELEISRFKSQDRIRTLKLKDLIFPFQVLYIGLALAFISFLCEIKFWNIIAYSLSKLQLLFRPHSTS